MSREIYIWAICISVWPKCGCGCPSAGGVRLMEGLEEEIKVIMYICNPQHFERAKRRNCFQPLSWR